MWQPFSCVPTCADQYIFVVKYAYSVLTNTLSSKSTHILRLGRIANIGQQRSCTTDLKLSLNAKSEVAMMMEVESIIIYSNRLLALL